MPVEHDPPTEDTGRASPIELSYAPPALQPTSGRTSVGQFVGGMASSIVAGWLLVEIGIVGDGLDVGGPAIFGVGIVVILITPVVLLTSRRTRLFGAGWLTALSLAFLALVIVCGR